MNKKLNLFTFSTILTSSISLLLMSGSALAQEQGEVDSEGLTVKQAIERASGENTVLHAVVIDKKRADLLVALERKRYVPTFSGEAGYRAGQTAQASPLGTQFITTQTLSSNAALQYTLPYGTSMSASLSFERAVQDSVVLGNLGTVYGTQLAMEVAQPWLRGFGKKVGESNLTDALYAYEIASLEEQAQANNVISQILTSYWTLWYLKQQQQVTLSSIEQQQESLELTKTRVAAGVASQADLVLLEAEIAQAKEEVATLKGRIISQQLELSRIMGGTEERHYWEATTELPDVASLPAENALLEQAYLNSPAARQAAQSILRSKLQAYLAENEAKPDFQTIATLSVNGIGDNVGSALSQFARFEAVVGYVGVRVSLPLVREGLKAQADRAQLSVERAETDLETAKQQLRAQILASKTDWEVARQRVELGDVAVKSSEKSVEMEQVRFNAGQVTSFQVTQAITRLKQARLRVVSARLDAELARIELMRLMGMLVEEFLASEG